ncbi:MAG: SRPBCC domain-containing protein, partial [Rhodopila sp.]|nr:SRPBCC domain-containing protein [Rhodopila sp.]
TDYPCGGVYREIIPGERLVFTTIATDPAGHPVIDGLTTVTFAGESGKTKMTVRTSGTALVDYAIAYLEGMEAGWTQSLERLDTEVASASSSH